MIDVRCKCGAVYEVHEGLIGHTFRCGNPACGETIKIQRQAEPDLLSAVVASTESKEGFDWKWPGWILVAVLSTIVVGVIIWVVYFASQHPEPASNSSSVPELSPSPANPIAALALPPLIRHWAGLPPCAGGKLPQRPITGQEIKPSIGTSGVSEIQIKNGTERDAIVSLGTGEPPQIVRLMYVRAKENYTMRRIEPGLYHLSFILGKDWVQGCNSFWEDSGFRQFEQILYFQNPIEGEKTVRSYEVTLHPVLDGNARTKAIDQKEFFGGN
jgi:hypothetical protein